MRHAADRLSVRCYIGYDLGESLPDHSSLTRIRNRYGVEVFRRFFEKIVEQCQEAGLVWGKELYIDATKVKANASLDTLTPRFAVEAPLTHLFDEEAEHPAEEAEQVESQKEEVSRLSPSKTNASVPMSRCPITTIAPSSLVQIASAMKPSAMSTCVQQAKNCIWISLIPPSVPCAIAHVPKTAITFHSKHSVPRANKGAASAAVCMRTIWTGSEPTTPQRPPRRPTANAVCESNRYLRKAKTGMACGASAYGFCGGSTVRHSCVRLGKISSGCSNNVAEDAVHTQQRPYMPSFWLLVGG